jgi:hypothetical protein
LDGPGRGFCDGEEGIVGFAAECAAVAGDVGFVFYCGGDAVEDAEGLVGFVALCGGFCCGEDEFGVGGDEGCGMVGEGFYISADEGEQ